MPRIAHLVTSDDICAAIEAALLSLAAILILSACAPYQHPLTGLCDYPDDEQRLRCQSMVLGLYQSGQNAMFSRWGQATHVEPIYVEPRPAAQSPFRSPPPVSCLFVGNQLLCN